MPALHLGPMLRHVDDTRATVWVETDAPCEVTVNAAPTAADPVEATAAAAGAAAATASRPVPTASRTFCVAGHHFARVVVDGLAPGSATPYEVHLDGARVWPEEDSPYPPSVLRTTHPDRGVRLTFGSCRVVRPDHEPYTFDVSRDARGVGVDALAALARRLRRRAVSEWPDLLMLVGDQVYADEVSPQTLEFVRERRDTTVPPYEQIADFEEYCQLYRESWSQPAVRWLLSTVPSAMIFDDHDVRDDWNTSRAWRDEMRATSWWQRRVTGGLAAYWLYQHLGNLSPEDCAADGTLAALAAVEDGWPLLHELATRADAEADGHKGYRWSYRRDLSRSRLLVIDSRCGRILDGTRDMVDDREWAWIREQTGGDLDHLLVATSLPVLLPAAVHHLESWNEAACAGAWGRRFAPYAEKVRQAADLEHWAAFRDSFLAMVGLLREVGSGRRGRAPGSILLLSGDVHFSYVAQAEFPARDGVTSPVLQLVCSPIRNPMKRRIQYADRFARTPAGELVGRALARSARVPAVPLRWRTVQGPWFQNAVTTVTLSGRHADVAVEQALPGSGEDPRLVTVWAGEVTP